MTELDTMFRHAVRVGGDFRLSARGPDLSESDDPVTTPHAVVGRSPSADLTLPDKTVSLRHAYVQPINGRVFACDLFSVNGTKSGDEPFKSGWVGDGAELSVGPYFVRVEGGSEVDDTPPPDRFKPRSEEHEFYGLLPEISLELIGHKKKAVWPLNRVLTLLGRDDRCRITCGHDSVSAVHCSLILTKSGLWVVDLFSRNGVEVNGEPQRCAHLSDGFELTVGKYRLRAHVEDQPTPPPAAPEPAPESTTPNMAFLTRGHRVFRVEPDGEDAVVVVPQGDQPQFAYQDIQTEANTVVHVVTTKGRPHVVVDFSSVRVVNSVIVESIASFCRAAAGRAVFCNATPEMYSVLEDMRLPSVWPHYLTRDDALAAVRFEG